MRRWPPAVWLCIFCGSLLVLLGVGGDWNPQAFIPGALLMLAGFGASLYLAYGERRRRPRARGVPWLVPATALFYIVAAAAAALAGGKYVIAALGASIVPLTAAALLVATTRSKPAGGDTEHEDPYPGIGPDDDTPLGDTSEHSDAERVAEPDRRSWVNPQHGRPA
jgi:peptidoglycan/LPS O-acetylase OafA/YrhL